MRRLVLLPVLAAALGLGGCVVRARGPSVPRAAPGTVYYGGEHLIPPEAGGGWCYIDDPHTHGYGPHDPRAYVSVDNHYYWRGDVGITYYSGHPLPGSGWCTLGGPHVHEYLPPRDDPYWVFRPRQGYVYVGPHTYYRPPPPSYWREAYRPPVYRPPPKPAVAPARPIAPRPGAAPAPPAAPRPGVAAPAGAPKPAETAPLAPRPGAPRPATDLRLPPIKLGPAPASAAPPAPKPEPASPAPGAQPAPKKEAPESR